MVWAATYAVAKPISHIREKRLEALHFAERYDHLRSTAPEESIRSARSAVGDLAAGMRALARDRLGIVNLYCSARRYDLEMAARCLLGLTQMVGDDSFVEENRRNNLDRLYYCLYASKHLSRARRAEIRNMLHAAARSS
jgi:hypothetical protein